MYAIRSYYEIIGRTDYDLFDKELSDWFRAHDKLAMDKGVPLSNEEWVHFSGDIEKTLLETTKTPMYTEDGDIVGVLGVAHVITSYSIHYTKLYEKFVSNVPSNPEL